MSDIKILDEKINAIRKKTDEIIAKRIEEETAETMAALDKETEEFRSEVEKFLDDIRKEFDISIEEETD